METQTIHDLIEQIRTVIYWSDHAVSKASELLTDNQYEAIGIGHLQDELTDLENLADKLKLEVWEHEINSTIVR